MIPHSWPQLLILMSIAAKFTGPTLRAAGVETTAPEWLKSRAKYRGTDLVVTAVSQVIFILILGYGGFWEVLG